MSNVLTIKDKANFQEVIDSNKICVIKFGASWSGPCKQIAPVFNNVSKNMENVTFVDVDVDESEELSERYEIQSIPTILFVKDGKIVDKSMGFMNEEDLKGRISKNS
ncbi:thioredoxin [Bacillus megaterium]|uniref:thioredoxin n=1 Tax=Priestia TaxID=2800373 RepID=UPI00129348A1|nr:thioredoxin [Priestia megaterium]MQR86733.1 thioredoxin [Priestia megaterium]